MNPFIYRR